MKDTTSAQKAAYRILQDIDKLIVDLESLEEIHDKAHEEKVIDDEIDEIRNVRTNLRATIYNAIEWCIAEGMETYTPLRQMLEVR